MKKSLPLAVSIVLFATLAGGCAGTHGTQSSPVASQGAYDTGVYPNLFVELLGKNDPEIATKIDSAFHQLFYGDNDSQRVYYPVGTDMAYIFDTGNNDVRTEGMSYGMMIAVQMDKKEEFDRLWRWAKKYMQFQDGPFKGYFAWHCSTDGTRLDSTAASDGEEWFVTALLFASARWKDGEGILAYRKEAGAILHTMLHKDEESERGRVTNMFNLAEHLVAFVPTTPANSFTDPSYQLPHFYELWGRWAGKDNAFWCSAAAASRTLLHRSADSITGLYPDYCTYAGKPVNPWDGGHDEFRFDAWRVGANIGVDWVWFGSDPWEQTEANRWLQFFHAEGVSKYVNQYTLAGKPRAGDRSSGLMATCAATALAATSDVRKEFVNNLWTIPIPAGQYRYYDGMLYLLGLLEVSGNFRIYDPTGTRLPSCKH